MSSDVWVRGLKKAGWAGFAPGEFLGVAFDRVGTAKVARNNWFVLLQSIPVLDTAGLERWSEQYALFWKRSQAGMFTRGKYFVLILVVDQTGDEAGERLLEEPPVGLLEVPDEIARGGGYAIVALLDRRQVLMPQEIVMWDIVHATEFAGRTKQAVVEAMKSLFPGEGGELRVAGGELRVTSWQ